MLDGRVCGLCARKDTELDHVFTDECMQWGIKPMSSRSRGNFCSYCIRTHAGTAGKTRDGMTLANLRFLDNPPSPSSALPSSSPRSAQFFRFNLPVGSLTPSPIVHVLVHAPQPRPRAQR
eukprot:9480194-Pyramimonas_sp.AAC.1